MINSTRSSLSKTFDDAMDMFDSTRRAPMRTVDELLYPSHVNYEYRRIRNSVIYHGKLSKEDNAATVIQKTYRMFSTRRLFLIYLKQYRRFKLNAIRPYFIALLLNSHVSSVNRREMYESQLSRALFIPRTFKNYTHPPFNVFTITGQTLVHQDIDDRSLCRLVKATYSPLVGKLFNHWRSIARQSKTKNMMFAKGKFDFLKRKLFRYEYICFMLWFRYVKLKKEGSVEAKEFIPDWQNYMNIVDEKNKINQKADNVRASKIKKTAIKALLKLVKTRRQERLALNDAYHIRMKKNMHLALQAWVVFIEKQKTKTNTTQIIFRKWFGHIQTKKHLKFLLKVFGPRHEIFIKRRCFSVFSKYRKISQIQNVYTYSKIQTKPSLALFAIASLQNDDNKSSFYLAMHAWASFIRRRRKWHNFVFQNVKTTDYDAMKRKVLAAFRRKKAPLQIPISFTSGKFRSETLYLYEYVMKSDNKNDKIFLVTDDEKAKEAVRNASSYTELRNIFFDAWKQMKFDSSLLIRISLIHMMHMRAKHAKEAMGEDENAKDSFQKAMTFLKSYNLASEGKFNVLQRVIAENDKRAILNRSKCVIRDNLIVMAHMSHHDAQKLNNINSQFTVNDTAKLLAQIQQLTNELQNSYTPLIDITSMGSVLEQQNTYSFTKVSGCKKVIPKFRVDLKKIRNHFGRIMNRAQISATNQIHFDKLISGRLHETGLNTARYYQNIDHYQNPSIKSKQLPYTGVNRILLEAFPLKQKNSISYKSDKYYPRLNSLNGDEDEIIQLRSMENDALRSSVLTLQKSRESMFFNTVNSFMNLAASSLFSSNLQSSSSINFKEIEEVKETENDKPELTEEEEDINDNNTNAENLIEYISDYEYEEQEILDSKGEPRPIYVKKKIHKRKPGQKLRELKETFDDVTTKGITKAAPLNSPRTQEKFNIFMDILFGKKAHDSSMPPLSNLKQKILTELDRQKHEATIPGIMIDQKDVRPLEQLFAAYRRDIQQRKTRLQNKEKDEETNHAPSGMRIVFTKTFSDSEDEDYYDFDSDIEESESSISNEEEQEAEDTDTKADENMEAGYEIDEEAQNEGEQEEENTIGDLDENANESSNSDNDENATEDKENIIEVNENINQDDGKITELNESVIEDNKSEIKDNEDVSDKNENKELLESVNNEISTNTKEIKSKNAEKKRLKEKKEKGENQKKELKSKSGAKSSDKRVKKKTSPKEKQNPKSQVNKKKDLNSSSPSELRGRKKRLRLSMSASPEAFNTIADKRRSGSHLSSKQRSRPLEKTNNPHEIGNDDKLNINNVSELNQDDYSSPSSRSFQQNQSYKRYPPNSSVTENKSNESEREYDDGFEELIQSDTSIKSNLIEDILADNSNIDEYNSDHKIYPFSDSSGRIKSKYRFKKEKGFSDDSSITDKEKQNQSANSATLSSDEKSSYWSQMGSSHDNSPTSSDQSPKNNQNVYENKQKQLNEDESLSDKISTISENAFSNDNEKQVDSQNISSNNIYGMSNDQNALGSGRINLNTEPDKELSKSALNVVDKLLNKYVNDSINDENDGLLVDVGEDDEFGPFSPEQLRKQKDAKKLWNEPKFYGLFKPKVYPKRYNLSGVAKSEKGPFIIKHEIEITPSMRQTINEAKIFRHVVLHDDQAPLFPQNVSKRRTPSISSLNRRPLPALTPLESSQSGKSSTSISNYSNKRRESDQNSQHSLPLPLVTSAANKKQILDQISQLEKSSSSGASRISGREEHVHAYQPKTKPKVVSFSGGKRGISEVSMDLQKIRNARQKQLLSSHQGYGKANHGASQFDGFSLHQEYYLPKKANEAEDISNVYSNLRNLVAQMIQMMASSQDDSDEFNRLRRRARMFRKLPSFIGIPNKQTTRYSLDSFSKQLQAAFLKYTRKRNVHAAADDILLLMKNNIEFAPMILNIIETIADQEKRYIDSKLQKSRIGSQPADKGMAVHFIDLDWLNGSADYYNAVALQYKRGHISEGDLEAIVAPTYLHEKALPDERINRGRLTNRGYASDLKYEIIPHQHDWDKTLDEFTSNDFMLISSMVPQELIDKVIEDHTKANSPR